MSTRILSSLIGLPLAFIIVLKGGIFLKVGTLLVSFIGLYEFYNAIYKKISFINIFGFLFSLVYIIILNTKFMKNLNEIFLIMFLIFLLNFVFFHNKINVFEISITFFGFFYITFMFSNIYLIRENVYGQYLVWFPFLCAWLSDTGAYFSGITLGKHKMTPILSPKKTIEGCIGGIFLSTLGTGLYGLIISKYFFIQSNFNFTLFSVLIGVVGSIFAQLGDLTASSIKRKFKIQDYGNIIPGHGGVLDRFDSIIFTSGVVYIFTTFLT